MIDEQNGNSIIHPKSKQNSTDLVTSISTDDLSQSLSNSEYTDADESMSAPTEFLAEFLSAVMLKDYKKALKYCKLILEFEPNNITAREFYPLIEEKMKLHAEKSLSDSDENDNVEDVGGGACATDLLDVSDSINEGESDFSTSSSDSDEKDLDVLNSNTSTGSENTTHSYSSSLLEEEDDLQPLYNKNFKVQSPDLSDLHNGNYKSTSCSDSESPTEPLTQKIAAFLKSK